MTIYMHELPLVYIAAPYTSGPVHNTNNVIKEAERLEEIFNVAVFIPHLTLLWDLISPAPVDVWYARDNHVLERCDAVYRLQGPSTGADAEVAYAREREIPVFFHDDPFVRFREWRQDYDTRKR
jgi:hypothetical protein